MRSIPRFRMFIIGLLLVVCGWAFAAFIRSNQPDARCLDANSAGFSSSASVIHAGGKTSVDVQLVLNAAPVSAFNFDLYVLVDGEVRARDLQVRVACGKPATRSIPLSVRPDQAVSVIYTRSVRDKIQEAKSDILARRSGRLNPPLLSDAGTIQGAQRLRQNALLIKELNQRPQTPTLSRMANSGEDISILPGVLEAAPPQAPFEVLLYNDTSKPLEYTVACLQGENQVRVQGAWTFRLFLAPQTYQTVKGVWIPKRGEVDFLHCYSLYTLSPPGVMKATLSSPIRPVYTLGL